MFLCYNRPVVNIDLNNLTVCLLSEKLGYEDNFKFNRDKTHIVYFDVRKVWKYEQLHGGEPV